VIERYTRPEMGAVWSEQRRLEAWLQVELAVVDALAEQGVVPEEDAAQVRERATFTVEAVRERERVTDHDLAAFVDVVAESVGAAGRWVHHGLTSSDILDTALALQIGQAGLLLVGGARDTGTRWCAVLASTCIRSARAAPTASRPSQPRSGSSWPASPSRHSAT
jgi:adenylosuccinate lyase